MTWDEFWNSYTPEPNTGCWLWTGPGVERGLCRIDGRPYQAAPRHVLESRIGRDLESWEYACHRCGVGHCVNPEHIYLGDARTNALDSYHGPEAIFREGRTTSRSPAHLSPPQEALARYLETSGESQRALAKRCGFNHSLLSRYARGEIVPSWTNAKALHLATNGWVNWQAWTDRPTTRRKAKP